MIIKNFPIYLIYLFPLFLITGPFLTDLSLTLLALIGIYQITKSRNWKNSINIFVILFFVFWIYITFVSILSNNPILSLESSLFYFRFIFFSISISFFLSKYFKHISKIKTIYSICILFVCVDALIQYVIGINILGFAKTDSYRLSGIFKNEFILGSYLSRLLPILLFFIFIDWKGSYSQIFTYVLVVLLSGITILLSGERSALFLFFLTMFLIIITIKNILKINLFIILILSVSFASILYLQSDIKERVLNYTLSQIYSTESNSLNIFSIEHQNHYLTAYKMFIDKPIIGHGSKMFRELCFVEKYYNNGCSTHPHNTYLQLLSETGLIGFLFISALFLYLFTKIIRFIFEQKIKSQLTFNNSKIVIVISLFTLLWPFIPTGSFFNNWLSSIYYFTFGLYFFSIYKKN